MEVRRYVHPDDFEPVSRMLVESYRPGRIFDPWLQPRWEYQNFHPLIHDIDRSRFGVAEQDGRLLGLIHNEHEPDVWFLQRRPGADAVVEPLLDWMHQQAEEPGVAAQPSGIGVQVPLFDEVVRRAVAARGYLEDRSQAEPQARFLEPAAVDPPSPPPGYVVRSLAEGNDPAALHAVLWHGFDHEGEPPPEGVEERHFMQSAPNYRHDLTMVAVAPDGSYASLCGMWVVPENRLGLVEPVATHPAHRRRGLGRAVVLGAVRRAAEAGADVVWVGSDLPFYRALGFEVSFTSSRWVLRP